MEYTIEKILEILKCTQGQFVRKDDKIEYLLTDSRNIIFSKKSLFIAITGKNHDGHDFIPLAYEQGIRNFLVEKIPREHFLDANFLCVENSIQSLQMLASFHRNKFHHDVIGIAGSNGKTIVKEWIFQVLKNKYHICKNPKSYNSQIGVPLSIWQLEKNDTLGIFEAGISQPNEMEVLEKIIQPTVGVFLNIGQAHSEGFISNQEKIIEKLKLFQGNKLDVFFYCIDYSEIESAVLQTSIEGIKISWSKKENPLADIHVSNIQFIENKTFFDIELIGRKMNAVEIPFSDEASLENAIFTLLVADHFGMQISDLREGLKMLTPVSMRLELKQGINGCQIINDVYSSDLNSLQIALNFLRSNKQNLQLQVILSDIDESGIDQQGLYQEVAELLYENKVEKLIGIGSAISSQQELFQLVGGYASEFYLTVESFIENFYANQFQQAFILIKGARRFQLERVSNLLTQKTHGTYLEIKLNHLIHNLNVYRSLLHPGVKTMCMVKAFSYGSGAAEIATVLANQHVDYLAVAYSDEGVALRRNGIHLPILVLNPEIDSFETMLHYQLEPEMYCINILKQFSAFVKQKNITQINVHLKIDTGMHRLGFEEADLQTVVQILKATPQIKIASIFSHLSSADEMQYEAFTEKQISIFKSCVEKIENEFEYPILKHILNSSGISTNLNAQFNMVRIGIGLYGEDPSKNISGKLLPVSCLYAPIAQIKVIKKGESVGYSRSFFATKEMKIATINIGYADGFSRRLSNGIGKVYVSNKFASVVGKVCMDMTMVDISEIENVHEGDLVEIFGNHISLQEISSMMQTIPYEVLTGISQRVKRIYVSE